MAPDFVQFSVSASTDAQQWPECLLTPSATEYPACVRLTTNLRTDSFFLSFNGWNDALHLAFVVDTILV